jgi:hypothetical protein
LQKNEKEKEGQKGGVGVGRGGLYFVPILNLALYIR